MADFTLSYSEIGYGNSDGEFQSAEDILDNVLASAGCKEFFNSESNFLETHFDLLHEHISESPSVSFLSHSSSVYPQVNPHLMSLIPQNCYYRYPNRYSNLFSDFPGMKNAMAAIDFDYELFSTYIH